MTPRVPLTSIGATAIAFAVAIGAASGRSVQVNNPESNRIEIAASPEHDRVVAYRCSEGEVAARERLALASWNDLCPSAV